MTSNVVAMKRGAKELRRAFCPPEPKPGAWTASSAQTREAWNSRTWLSALQRITWQIGF